MLGRLLTLLAIVIAGLSAVLLLPAQIRLLDSAVRQEWPIQAGPWVKMRDAQPSPQEISILAKDTKFFKAQYMRSGSNVPVDVGIVLSGDDINNSIHRPERCLVAQGHTDLTNRSLEIPLSGGHTLPVTRLTTRLRRELQKTSKDDGPAQVVACQGVTYYWFVGHDIVTSSHYARTFKDMSDRLLNGSNQRWAYITLSVYLNDTPEVENMLADPNGQVDRLLQDFIINVVPGMIDYGMIKE